MTAPTLSSLAFPSRPRARWEVTATTRLDCWLSRSSVWKADLFPHQKRPRTSNQRKPLPLVSGMAAEREEEAANLSITSQKCLTDEPSLIRRAPAHTQHSLLD